MKNLLKVIAILMLVVMGTLAVAPALADHETDEAKTYIVATANGRMLNVRDAMSKKTGRIIARLPKGTLIPVFTFYREVDGKMAETTYEKSTWAEMQLSDGTIAYVMTKFIRPVK